MKTLTTHPFTVQALQSPLACFHEQPQWFLDTVKHYEEQNKPAPQIIDTLVLDEQEIFVLWVPHSAHAIDKSPQKSGWHISCIQYHFADTGEEIAYVKAIYATEESIAVAGDKSDAKIISSPVIDFAKVYDVFRGQGIGQSMYVYLARKLAEQDMMLRASGCQTHEAQSMWKRMLHDPLLPISTTDEKFVLDFRQEELLF